MRALTRSVVGLSVVAVVAFGVAACDGENRPGIGVTLPGDGVGGGGDPVGPGDGGDAGEPTDPPAPQPTDAPAPESTEPPAPQPTDAPAPQPTDAPDAGGDTGEDSSDWSSLLLVLLGVAAVGAVIAVVVGSRQKSTAASETDQRRELVATAGWVHDQLTLEVLAVPPADGLRRWTIERSRVDQLAIDGRVMASSGYREMWEQLGTILGRLTSSIDTALRLGAMEGTDPTLVAEAVRNAHRQRAELGAWVATARSLV